MSTTLFESARRSPVRARESTTDRIARAHVVFDSSCINRDEDQDQEEERGEVAQSRLSLLGKSGLYGATPELARRDDPPTEEWTRRTPGFRAHGG
jgi:hypothetical protein